MQFVHTLYAASIITLCIFIAICYFEALLPVSTQWLFITSPNSRRGSEEGSLPFNGLGSWERRGSASTYTQKPVQLQDLGHRRKQCASSSRIIWGEVQAFSLKKDTAWKQKKSQIWQIHLLITGQKHPPKKSHKGMQFLTLLANPQPLEITTLPSPKLKLPPGMVAPTRVPGF